MPAGACRWLRLTRYRHRHRQADNGADPGSRGVARGQAAWLGPAGTHGDQASASLLQRVVIALPLGPDVLRPGLLAEGIEHRLQRRSALGRQVTVELPRAPVAEVQPHRPVSEPIAIAVWCRGALAHLLRQPGEVREIRATIGGSEQDHVRVATSRLRQLVRPVTDLTRPGRGDPASGQGPLSTWCSFSRRIQPTAPAAAAPVTRARHFNHDRAGPWPSCSKSPAALNAGSTADRAAVRIGSARSSPRKHPARSTPVRSRAAASQLSASRAIATAAATDDGTGQAAAPCGSPGTGDRPGTHTMGPPHGTTSRNDRGGRQQRNTRAIGGPVTGADLPKEFTCTNFTLSSTAPATPSL
jgi:hypothetical protein